MKVAEGLHRFARKLSALSFILLILVGHFWFFCLLLGEKPLVGMSAASTIGIVGALSGGLLLFVLRVMALFTAPKE